MDKEYAEYLLRKTKEDYNLIAEDFSRTRWNIWAEFSVFKDYIKDNDKILDAGCGNGRILELLEDKKINYVGVDISEKLIELAKEKYPQNNFLVADTLNLPFPDNNFDKIFSIAVLHHIPSEEFRLQSLEELRRVLKKDGFLFITVWNLWQKKTAFQAVFKNVILKLIRKTKLDFKDIFYPWKDQNKRIIAQRYFHLFTKREFKRITEKAGFIIKEIGILERPDSKDNNLYLIAEK